MREKHHALLLDKSVISLALVSAFCLIASQIYMFILMRSHSGSSFIAQFRPSLGASKAFQKSTINDFRLIAVFLMVYGLFSLSISYIYYARRRDMAIVTLYSSILLCILFVLVARALMSVS
jgi:hypothetical protein